MRNLMIFGLAAMILVLLLTVGGIALIAANSSATAVGTLASGRTVQVSSDSFWLTCRYEHDTATIRTAGQSLVVTPTALLVDGRFVAPLAPDAKSVVVTAAGGALRLTADGAQVFPPTPGKQP